MVSVLKPKVVKIFAVIEQMTAPWNETTLSTLLSNYKLENLFNADEFGLF